MASINTIPIEVLEKIVDLTVEDAIALRGGGRDDHEQEKLRRKILIRIAVVSKDFTRPAQLALWRYMEMNDFMKVGGLIEAGFGKDKVIEELRICISLLPDDENDIFNSFLSFLRGVKRVISITNMTIYGFNLRFEEFFEIDSIKALESFALHHYSISLPTLATHALLPSQLRHLTIGGLSKEMNDIISLLIESSFSTLTSIELFGIKSSEYSGSSLSSVIPLRLGPKLRKLDVTDLDNSILSSLLPHCTSLKSLSIYSSIAETFDIIVDTLGTMPQSVILASFSITLPLSRTITTPDLIHFSACLQQLLQTLPFIQLKRINLAPFSRYGNDRLELVDFVNGKNDFTELVEKRGIVVGLGKEEEALIGIEKEKQKIYNERQVKLDLESNRAGEKLKSYSNFIFLSIC